MGEPLVHYEPKRWASSGTFGLGQVNGHQTLVSTIGEVYDEGWACYLAHLLNMYPPTPADLQQSVGEFETVLAF